MYRVTTSNHIHFAHHVFGHAGPCISLHGHTWKFEITLAAEELDVGGFVVDFDVVHQKVLEPCHLLLDHSLALSREFYEQNKGHLEGLGQSLVATRKQTIGGMGCAQAAYDGELNGARDEWPGGIKVSVFPFAPTSERLAEWLFQVAGQRLADDRVQVDRARVVETLHPVECVGEYTP